MVVSETGCLTPCSQMKRCYEICVRLPSAVVIVLVLLLISSGVRAESSTLLVELGGQKRQFSVAELLANPATRTIEIPRDVSYGRSMQYQAIPLLDLLRGLPADTTQTLEARAADGFASQLPWTLIAHGATGGAVAWIAIEDPAHPWPRLKGKPYSAGPFYLVWEHPERSGIVSEQWPYALASLVGDADPLQRWPQLSLDSSVSAGDPARRGQAVYIVQCLPCHRLRGAGNGDQGPDLGRPMPVTAYFTALGLRALIRDPASVRTWPRMQMSGFDAANLSDADIDAVIAYLGRITGTPAR
jgi:mono/diheme cytochrome c family protein